MKIRYMKRLFFFLSLLLVAWTAVGQINDLPRSTPEEQGVPSMALIHLFDSLHQMPQTDIHSMIVMRHGKVIGEFYPAPFAAEYQHTQYSSSKTLVSMAVGIAVDEGKLKLTDRVVSFFPEHLPDTLSSRLKDMTLRDLLTMTSGIKPDWAMRSRGTEWIKTFLSKEVIHEPGEVFAYDSMVTYMLSAIVQQVTGMKTLDYLKIKLFNPMGIEVVNWEESPEGINTGGWGLHIQSESLAKIGQLWLDGGLWQGQRLISQEWIQEMSSKQADGGDFGYGYQTWMCAYPGAVRADGALGQYVIVVPEKDVVIVLTEASFTNGKPQRGLIWNQFLPALQDQPLPPSEDYALLKQKEKAYQLELPQGRAASSVFKKVAGKYIALSKNKYGWKGVTFAQGKEGLELKIISEDGSSYVQPFGYQHWLRAEIAGFPPYSINPIGWHQGLEGPFYASGSYAWEDHVLNMSLHYVNWVTSLHLRWTFEDQKIILEISNNYAKNKVDTYTGRYAGPDTYERGVFVSPTTADTLLYRYLTPSVVESGKKYPLVLFLHGSGERGNDNQSQLLHGGQMFLNPVNQENYPAYVLFPQCPEGISGAYVEPLKTLDPERMPQDPPVSPLMQTVMDLIYHYRSLPTVDPNRIYIIGLSMGAMATYDLVCRYPDVFAAAIPICGSVNPSRLTTAAGVSFRIFHGDADAAVPTKGSREAYRMLRSLGADVEYIEFPGCTHGSWNPAFNYPDFMQWLFDQKK